MDVCPDYEDLFKIFNAHKIKYLIVGGQAAIYYTEPRYTKDMDVWVIQELNDPKKILGSLKNFGAPLKGVTIEDFKNKNIIIQIGVAPVRIDILLNVEGVSFSVAWKNRKRAKYGETPINLLNINDLIKSKKHAGRPQDMLDLEKLLDVKGLSKKRKV
ncbi:MAG: hypothetical protein HQM16_04085 [Deltaproteobacteria bacterium]|nr:hypothetical protein [Deltaproteobacteria bacterium]